MTSYRITQHVETHSARTGRHRHFAVHMPDGTVRAVWRRYDGPDFDGYYTAEPGGEERRTTREDYDEYTRRRFPR